MISAIDFDDVFGWGSQVSVLRSPSRLVSAAPASRDGSEPNLLEGGEPACDSDRCEVQVLSLRRGREYAAVTA